MDMETGESNEFVCLVYEMPLRHLCRGTVKVGRKKINRFVLPLRWKIDNSTLVLSHIHSYRYNIVHAMSFQETPQWQQARLRNEAARQGHVNQRSEQATHQEDLIGLHIPPTRTLSMEGLEPVLLHQITQAAPENLIDLEGSHQEDPMGLDIPPADILGMEALEPVLPQVTLTPPANNPHQENLIDLEPIPRDIHPVTVPRASSPALSTTPSSSTATSKNTRSSRETRHKHKRLFEILAGRRPINDRNYPG